MDSKNVTTNIYKIQANYPKMSRHFWTVFIDFMLKVGILLDYTNLFSHN